MENLVSTGSSVHNVVEVIDLDSDDTDESPIPPAPSKYTNIQQILLSSTPQKGKSFIEATDSASILQDKHICSTTDKTISPKSNTSMSKDSKSGKTLALIPIDCLKYCDMKDGKFRVKINTLNKLQSEKSVYLYDASERKSLNKNHISLQEKSKNQFFNSCTDISNSTDRKMKVIQSPLNTNATDLSKLVLIPKNLGSIKAPNTETTTKIRTLLPGPLIVQQQIHPLIPNTHKSGNSITKSKRFKSSNRQKQRIFSNRPIRSKNDLLEVQNTLICTTINQTSSNSSANTINILSSVPKSVGQGKKCGDFLSIKCPLSNSFQLVDVNLGPKNHLITSATNAVEKISNLDFSNSLQCVSSSSKSINGEIRARLRNDEIISATNSIGQILYLDSNKSNITECVNNSSEFVNKEVNYVLEKDIFSTTKRLNSNLCKSNVLEHVSKTFEPKNENISFGVENNFIICATNLDQKPLHLDSCESNIDCVNNTSKLIDEKVDGSELRKDSIIYATNSIEKTLNSDTCKSIVIDCDPSVDLPNILKSVVSLNESKNIQNTLEHSLSQGLKGDGIPSEKIQELENMIQNKSIIPPFKVKIPSQYLKYCAIKNGKHIVDINVLKRINIELQNLQAKHSNNSILNETLDNENKEVNQDEIKISDLQEFQKPVGHHPYLGDQCRYFFMKSSAWNHIDPENNHCRGFNEREVDTSHVCFKKFSVYLNGMRREYIKLRADLCKNPDRRIDNLGQNKSSNYSCNDLFFTKKIDILDKKGRKIRTEHIAYDKRDISDDEENSKKQKLEHVSECLLSKVKACSVVLKRNAVAEEKLKWKLEQKKIRKGLDSKFLRTSSSLRDIDRPIIILNETNIHVVSLDENFCRKYNVIFLKNEEDDFTEGIYKNELFIDLVEKKLIKITSPSVLRDYFR